MCISVESRDLDLEWTKSIVEIAVSPMTVAVADVNGNGLLDVVTASSTGDYFVWRENIGETFTREILGTAGEANGARDVFVIDVDGDGYQDIIGASSSDDTIAWYRQTQSGNVSTFTRNIITSVADNVQSVFAIDLDGDGDVDILSGNWNAGSITWWENDGSQRFTRTDISTDANAVYDVFAIDMDGDGDLDVVSATGSGFDLISWHENDGSQAFTKHIIFQDALRPRSVYPIDFNGDGHIDVIAGSEGYNSVWLFQNNGSQFFTTHIVGGLDETSCYGARGVYPADIDKDGDLDIVASCYNTNSVVWYDNDGTSLLLLIALIALII